MRRPFDYWDCSNLGLIDLPKEVLHHRRTLRQLTLATNNIKDVPKVRVENGRRGTKEGNGGNLGVCFWRRRGVMQAVGERGKGETMRTGDTINDLGSLSRS